MTLSSFALLSVWSAFCNFLFGTYAYTYDTPLSSISNTTVSVAVCSNTSFLQFCRWGVVPEPCITHRLPPPAAQGYRVACGTHFRLLPSSGLSWLGEHLKNSQPGYRSYAGCPHDCGSGSRRRGNHFPRRADDAAAATTAAARRVVWTRTAAYTNSTACGAAACKGPCSSAGTGGQAHCQDGKKNANNKVVMSRTPRGSPNTWGFLRRRGRPV